MANQTKMVFGSATTVCSLAATLANGANTYAGLASYTQTELDNSTDLYPWAIAVFNNPDTFSAAPTVGSTIDLFMVNNDIDGTSDETPVPAGLDIDNLAKLVGQFVLDNQDVANRKWCIISLAGVKKAFFDFKNVSGQTLSYTSNAITVKVTPFTYGPA